MPRFIPACAGNTTPCRTTAPPASVHPRVRGEHCARIGLVTLIVGSSPRARGTQPHRRQRRQCDRFIPACAGNTSRSPCSPATASVHPRVRGEHGHPDAGKRADDRFIPACAGNTAIKQYGANALTGSSPRARGTRMGTGGGAVTRRFIPACAGNTLPVSALPRMPPVHPRVRGEYSTPVPATIASHGSSPRARGTHCQAAGVGVERRFIPACAGNTLHHGR